MTVRNQIRISADKVEDQIGRPILIIEDQVSLALLVKAMLQERWGCDVHLAHSLGEARARIAIRQDYMVALCDLNLPDGEHGEVIDVVMKAGIPSIAMTAAFGNELREAILKKGVVDYVLKNSVNAYSYVCELIGRLSKNRSIKVLVVDDSLSIRAVLKQSLQMYGLQVLLAKDGKEGLALLQQHPDIRVMLVDFYMPELDGMGLTLAARKTHGKDRLSIIGMSSGDDPMFTASFLKNGANDFIRKPLHFEEVICRVNLNLEMLELIETNQKAANHDFLTGLYNRRFYFGDGERQVKLGLSQGTEMFVTMIDIDFFKKINDQYGHDCGDLVLKTVAQRFAASFNEDLPARIGGEEFVVLTVGKGRATVLDRVEALRQAIESLSVPWDKEVVKVTISAGIVAVDAEGLDLAMQQADAYLYQAKSAGRNRVVVAPLVAEASSP